MATGKLKPLKNCDQKQKVTKQLTPCLGRIIFYLLALRLGFMANLATLKQHLQLKLAD